MEKLDPREILKGASEIFLFVDASFYVESSLDELDLPEKTKAKLKNPRDEIWDSLKEMSFFTTFYTEEEEFDLTSYSGEKHILNLNTMLIDNRYRVNSINYSYNVTNQREIEIESWDFREALANSFIAILKDDSPKGYSSKFNFESMDRNTFNIIVKSGALTGKDVLSVCSVNSKVNSWCDMNFYKTRLEEEFGRERTSLDSNIDYRDLYIKMHLTYWYITHDINHSEGDFNVKSFNHRQSIALNHISKIFDKEIIEKPYFKKYYESLYRHINSRLSKTSGIKFFSDKWAITYLGEFLHFGGRSWEFEDSIVFRSTPDLRLEDPRDFKVIGDFLYVLSNNGDLYSISIEALTKKEGGLNKIASDIVFMVGSHLGENSVVCLNSDGQFFREDGFFRQDSRNIKIDPDNIRIIFRNETKTFLACLTKENNLQIAVISEQYISAQENDVKFFSDSKYKVESILNTNTYKKEYYSKGVAFLISFINYQNYQYLTAEWSSNSKEFEFGPYRDIYPIDILDLYSLPFKNTLFDPERKLFRGIFEFKQ